MGILRRIFGKENPRISVRRDSFVLMRIFDNLGVSSIIRSRDTDSAERVLYTLYASRVRNSLTTDPTLVCEITDNMMNDDREKVSDYMEKRSEFAQAIEAFIVNVAEKTLESGTPDYRACWVALTKAADAVHKYVSKDDTDEAARYQYQLAFPRVLRDAKKAWRDVPEVIHEDMAALLRIAYEEEARMYIDGVLEQIIFSP